MGNFLQESTFSSSRSARAVAEVPAADERKQSADATSAVSSGTRSKTTEALGTASPARVKKTVPGALLRQLTPVDSKESVRDLVEESAVAVSAAEQPLSVDEAEAESVQPRDLLKLLLDARRRRENVSATAPQEHSAPQKTEKRICAPQEHLPPVPRFLAPPSPSEIWQTWLAELKLRPTKGKGLSVDDFHVDILKKRWNSSLHHEEAPGFLVMEGGIPTRQRFWRELGVLVEDRELWQDQAMLQRVLLTALVPKAELSDVWGILRRMPEQISLPALKLLLDRWAADEQSKERTQRDHMILEQLAEKLLVASSPKHIRELLFFACARAEIIAASGAELGPFVSTNASPRRLRNSTPFYERLFWRAFSPDLPEAQRSTQMLKLCFPACLAHGNVAFAEKLLAPSSGPLGDHAVFFALFPDLGELLRKLQLRGHSGTTTASLALARRMFERYAAAERVDAAGVAAMLRLEADRAMGLWGPVGQQHDHDPPGRSFSKKEVGGRGEERGAAVPTSFLRFFRNKANVRTFWMNNAEDHAGCVVDFCLLSREWREFVGSQRDFAAEFAKKGWVPFFPTTSAQLDNAEDSFLEDASVLDRVDPRTAVVPAWVAEIVGRPPADLLSWSSSSSSIGSCNITFSGVDFSKKARTKKKLPPGDGVSAAVRPTGGGTTSPDLGYVLTRKVLHRLSWLIELDFAREKAVSVHWDLLYRSSKETNDDEYYPRPSTQHITAPETTGERSFVGRFGSNDVIIEYDLASSGRAASSHDNDEKVETGFEVVPPHRVLEVLARLGGGGRPGEGDAPATNLRGELRLRYSNHRWPTVSELRFLKDRFLEHAGVRIRVELQRRRAMM